VAPASSAHQAQNQAQPQSALADLDAFIESEIETRMGRSVSWSKLEPCFKWVRVKQYLAAAGVTENDPRVPVVREMLRANKLTQVEYDAHRRKVVRLGHADL
jgi:hypothetical protein